MSTIDQMIAEDASEASQAFFAKVAERMAERGYPCSGDVDPGWSAEIDEISKRWVRSYALNNDDLARLLEAGSEDAGSIGSVKLEVGDRVRTVGTIERYPHFRLEAGMMGTVVEYGPDAIDIRLDDVVPGAEEWDNCVCWNPSNDDVWPMPEEIEVVA